MLDPSEPKSQSMPSIGIAASLKMTQNSPVMIAANIITPSIGWVNARSRRSVSLSGSLPVLVSDATSA